ncbi:non-canonical (house-cleaning) NTP pyrophosphatase [Microbacterium immunditiarum]|uniref:Non-canonical (House-cleaning) NTP pyrophosphatase n=1 Tax=Microbacterium immunditiarum TaxID=337480 RepID=A0A7Y9GM39_9MICO|nr:non-canonical (house-cleaning) NTP pyrophosphatase [Microbacterium immunditiarum]
MTTTRRDAKARSNQAFDSAANAWGIEAGITP